MKIPNLRYPLCDARYNFNDTCTLNENERDFWHRESYLDDLVAFHNNRFKETEFSNLTRKYGLSFYWSALTLTTLGEQPWPNNSIEMCFEISNTLFGLMLFAIIIGDIGSMVTHINFARSNFEDFRDGCKLYMKFRGVNKFTEKRILNYLDFNWFQGDTAIDETELAKTLPSSLYSQLIAAVHLQTLKNVELFRDCESAILNELIKRLRIRTYGPGDFVCKKNEIGKEMYLVKDGRLRVLKEEKTQTLCILEDGAVFGELSILDIPGNRHKNRRSASIQSIGYSTLYALTKDDLWQALCDYPQQHKNLTEKGKQILRRNNLLDEMNDDVSENFSTSLNELHNYSTIEDRLLNISETLKNLNALTEHSEQHFYSTLNEFKQRITGVERKFVSLVDQGKLKRLTLRPKRHVPRLHL